MRRIAVATEPRPYEVLIGPGLIARAAPLLEDLMRARRVLVVTDAHVAPAQGAALQAGLGLKAADFVILPPGEETKSFAGLEGLIDKILERRLDRGDLLIAFGGGVVGDLAGFAAAIYKRGVDFIQIPTTLLAQVDSSVGGKTAIDTPRGKNLVGAFHQPLRVLADLDVLRTLPERELRCGYAEIVKCALLGDAAFFGWLEENRDGVLRLETGPLGEAVARAVQMKADIVAEDEKEHGRRALLNLGHTFGHALEAETGFGGRLLHGEAVAAGLCLAFRFAEDLGRCPGGAADRVAAHLRPAGLPTRLADIWPAEPPSAARLIEHMAQDKKARGGVLTFVLPEAVGRCVLTRDVEADKLERFLKSEGAA